MSIWEQPGLRLFWQRQLRIPCSVLLFAHGTTAGAGAGVLGMGRPALQDTAGPRSEVVVPATRAPAE